MRPRVAAVGAVIAMVAVLTVFTAGVALTSCSTGSDAVAQGGTFDFVSPGGQTDIFYDPPGERGTIEDLSGACPI